MSAPRLAHVKAMKTLMKYVVATKNRGLVLAPDTVWGGSREFQFWIGGRSDSDYAANTDDRRSVLGGRVFANEAPATFRSATQKFVASSVTEAEGAAGVMTVQDMPYVYCLFLSMGLAVGLPMVPEMDNKGAVDLANNWSMGDRTWHMDVQNYLLRDLKDEGLLAIKQVSWEDNDAGISTKNTTGPLFEKHNPNIVGVNEYMDWDADTPEPQNM